MSEALVTQSKAITGFQRGSRGEITVNDPDAFVKASEQVKALNSVGDKINELMEPFIKSCSRRTGRQRRSAVPTGADSG